jgi:glycosyltransferase involved in cell wall biosynthesis
MRVGISVACLGRKDAGPETYEREIIAHMALLPVQHEYRVYCFTPAAKRAVPAQNEHLRAQVLWPGSRHLSLSLTLPFMLLRDRVDVYHATFAPMPFHRKNTVLTMHDVSPFTHPQFYPSDIRRRLTHLLERGLKNANLIICVSEHCRQTTQELFKISSDRLVVIPHGVNESFYPMDKNEARNLVKERLGISGPYMLYVGKLEARKNISRLLRAFHQFQQRTKSDLKLILAGRRFWDLDDIDRTIAELNIASSIRELGYVPDQDLRPLYSGSEFFVFPSLWEGFGFPIVEAMKSGAPVITSNISCLPEIAGDAAELVDPESVDQIADAMVKLSSDPTLCSQMIQKGLEQGQKFTWESAAQKTVAAYERTAAA